MLKKIIFPLFCLVFLACELEIQEVNSIILDSDAIYLQTGTAIKGDHIGVVRRITTNELEEGVFNLLAEESLEDPTIQEAAQDGFTFEVVEQSVANAIEMSNTGVITINDISAFDASRYDRIIVNYIARFGSLSKEGTFFIDIIIDTSNSEFRIVWQVEAGETIQLPLYSGDDTEYDFTVNWENNGNAADDVAVTSYDDEHSSYTYAVAGLKTITIKGLLRGFNFTENTTSASSFIDVEKWGYMYFGGQQGVFSNCVNLVDFTATDTPLIGSTTNMDRMFFGASSFNGNINGWNVAQVTSLAATFRNAVAFNRELNDWNVSSVTSMVQTFFNAQAFNQDLNNWDVSNVTNFAQTFRNCFAFNGNVSSWDVSNSTNMGQMFRRATVFNSDIGSWDTSNVGSFAVMFNLAEEFNQDISGWTVSSVTSMANMFSGATNFSQDLSGWDTSIVSNCKNFDLNSALTKEQLPKLGCF